MKMNRKKRKQGLRGTLSWKRFAMSLLKIYIILLIFIYLIANFAIFQPKKASYKDGQKIIKIETIKNTYISAMYLENPKAEFTVLYNHGNAEDIGDMNYVMKAFKQHGFSILMYDYRGYGTSDGKPSAKRACEDADAAYKYMVDELGITPNKIIVYGRSMGSAMAIHVARKNKVAGIIIEGGFVSAFRVITHISLVPFDKFKNISKIRDINCASLFIHGKKDRIVKFWHGQALFEKANNPKMNLWVTEASHNDLFWMAGEDYWITIEKFINMIKTNN